MTNSNKIQDNLPKKLWDYASEFDIPEDFLEKDANLIKMVLESKSIWTDEEKQNWFDLMPLMNSKQFDKLRSILDKEKKKLQAIEEKYNQKETEIKKKYLKKWQKMWYVKKVKEIKQKEQSQKSKDQKEAEDLLDKI